MIAIISILAAILFPVFAQAREKARQTACLSNMRQMSLGVMMYAQDYDETLPLAATATPTGFLNWHDLVDPYMKNKQIWICPNAKAPIKDIYGKPVCHYGWNAYYLNRAALIADQHLFAQQRAGRHAGGRVAARASGDDGRQPGH